MKLPVCPKCGAAPEFHWKDYRFGSCSGALKCPYDHYRVQESYWAGSRKKAKQNLEEKWIAETGVKNG
ncbi:hypothetical protein B1209_12565 [Raoultella planticola]|jgi:hypothetical protein|nr:MULTISPECIES: hypothetical protein [Klebsiella/Raoultella group]AUU06371.1 hypothetical protein MC50_022295 [Raoultella planticola]AUV53516.1 hypothetical protein B1209_12565 [Raoultella planticola]MBA2103219.1 hypothetical protein [Klebsiella pneumoniae subsp. pneumoniae]MBK0686114.1 hypothetical protein [Klebsiella pneumoniae]MBX4661177.1 hypothetical protein [Klebsiella michiganensis]